MADDDCLRQKESVTELGEKEQWGGEDFRESCSLCLEPYKGRTPKLLPCFHTYCLPCLTTLAQSAGSATPVTTAGVGSPESGDGTERESKEDVEKEGEGKADEEENNITSRPVFLCPACRSTVTVPEGGVGGLQTNFYIVTEEEQEGGNLPLSCEMCEEGEEKEAEFACDKCQQWMCRTCRNLHDKLLDPTEHHVRPLTRQIRGPGAGSRTSVRMKKCQVHTDQELCLFCKDCDVSVCLVCKLTSHQPHVTVDMATVSVKEEELTTLVTSAKEQVQVMKKLLTRLSRDRKELSRQEQEAAEQVQRHCDDVISWARRSRDELLEAVSAQSQSAEAGLEEEEASVRHVVDSLSRLLRRASAAVGHDHSQVLLMKKELQSALLKEEEFRKSREESDRQEPRRLVSVRRDASVLSLETVRGFVGRQSVEGSGESPPETVSNRVTKLQVLASKLSEMERTVAFHAYLFPEKFAIPLNGKVVFSTVTVNVGNAYNSDTGVFTAPVAGVYSFHAVVKAKATIIRILPSGVAAVGLCSDGATLARPVCSGESWTLSSIHAMLQLDKDQRVFLKNLSPFHGLELLNNKFSDPPATFFGFLVSKV